jgi:hypothetical protein
MLARLKPGTVLLRPLVIRSSQLGGETSDKPFDALIELEVPGEPSRFWFAVESKSRATPEAVHAATAQARSHAQAGQWPMIQVPYLADVRLEQLERDKVSGIDLCGNGVVIVPGQLWVVRSGHPNLYPDSRALNNPYRGRSALVARTLLSQPRWPTLKALVNSIKDAGGVLSLAQASKAVRALEEEMIVFTSGSAIRLHESLRLLDKLGAEWRKPAIGSRQPLRLRDDKWAARLSSDPALQWAVTGESSASRYAMVTQGGPRRLAVSNLELATSLLGAAPEPVLNFADVELLETDEPGFFFGADTDDKGIRWAGELQTWLELQAGDARQQDAARGLRSKILNRAQS